MNGKQRIHDACMFLNIMEAGGQAYTLFFPSEKWEDKRLYWEGNIENYERDLETSSGTKK